MIYQSLNEFVAKARDHTRIANTKLRLTETRKNRIHKRFGLSEISKILGCEPASLAALIDREYPIDPNDPSANAPIPLERTFSIQDVAKIRALAALDPDPGFQKVTLPWRKPGDKLPVITVHSLKGGTGKSATASSLAIFSAHFMGLRVAVIDADPQATCSLYFVDDRTKVIDLDVATFVNFMGLENSHGRMAVVPRDPRSLNSFWKSTPWPGIRLMPGGSSIQLADMTLHQLSLSDDSGDRQVHRMLRDTIARWDRANPPRTSPSDLVRPDGTFNDELYRTALDECVDLIVIDTAPSLSLAQINTVMACDTLILPQTMRGADLASMSTYLDSLHEYLSAASMEANPVKFGPNGSMILPTMVSPRNDKDTFTVGEFYHIDPDFISPVYSKYLEAIANPFHTYQSPYEYVAPVKSLKPGLKSCIDNANAVSENILRRAVPGLPNRGFADDFITEKFEGAVPTWAERENSQ